MEKTVNNKKQIAKARPLWYDEENITAAGYLEWDKSQRYQAAVDGHEKAAFVIGRCAEKAEATGVRSRNTDLLTVRAGLLGAVLWVLYAVVGISFLSPLWGLFFMPRQVRIVEAGCFFPVSSGG